MSRLDALNEFYGPFSERLTALEDSIEGDGNRVFQVPSDVTCDVCGSPMELRYWKGSFFLGCTDYPTCRNTVNLPPDLSVQYGAEGVKVKEALAAAAEERSQTIPCSTCGGEMEMKTGRFGRYYKCTDPECRLCMENCPMDGIDLSMNPPVIAKPCEGCGFCAKICPTGALDESEWVNTFKERTAKFMDTWYATFIDKQEAEGKFRRLVPKDKIGRDTPIGEVYTKHPQWLIGKGFH